jgi:Protein of unknown function (DUF4199)
MMATRFRWAPLVVVGLVSGFVHVAAGVIMYLSGVYFAPWSVRFMTALLAVCIVAGNWWYGKHVLGGCTTYWKALLVGVVISVSTGLVYITYNVVSISFVYPHFLEDMIQAEFARASVGMDAAGAAQLLDSLRAEITLRTIVAGNFAAVCRLGTMLSVLISVGFIGRWRRVPRAVEERA